MGYSWKLLIKPQLLISQYVVSLFAVFSALFWSIDCRLVSAVSAERASELVEQRQELQGGINPTGEEDPPLLGYLKIEKYNSEGEKELCFLILCLLLLFSTSVF